LEKTAHSKTEGNEGNDIIPAAEMLIGKVIHAEWAPKMPLIGIEKGKDAEQFQTRVSV
jgi:hypothetical protein